VGHLGRALGQRHINIARMTVGRKPGSGRAVMLIEVDNEVPADVLAELIQVPGVREALHKTKGRIAAVSPIVAGEAVAGPAGILMAAQGLPVSVAGVAQAYHDFLDMLIIDVRDAEAGDELRKSGLLVHVAKTVMRTSEDKADLASAVLTAVRGQNAAAAGPDHS